ncbi:hypothetical protein OSTOST_04805 [Ostertagia ostertagi]
MLSSNNIHTPRASHPVQDRPVKRKPPCASPIDSGDGLVDAIKSLTSDTTLPSHVKTILAHLLEKTASMEDLQQKLENERLRREIDVLRNSLGSGDCNGNSAVQTSSTNTQSDINMHCCSEHERLSALIPAQTARVSFDFEHIKKIFHFLSIECFPSMYYRMGKPTANRSRLLKVVLPNSFFQKQILSRASLLKHFPLSGIYIRPSLTKIERDRLRSLRALRNKQTGTVVASSTQPIISPSSIESNQPPTSNASVSQSTNEIVTSQISSNQ